MFPLDSLSRTIIWIITGIGSLLVVVFSIILENNIGYFLRGLFPQLRNSRGRKPSPKPKILWFFYTVFTLIVILGTAIASSAPEIGTPDPIIPIRADMSFPSTGKCGAVTGHMIYPPVNEIPDDLKMEDLSNWLYERHEFVNSTFIETTLTSLSGKEWVRISNKIRAKVVNYKELSEPLDAILPMCGGGQIRDFPVITIDKTKKEFSATFPEFDYFTLQPGEFEVFDLQIKAIDSGEYDVVIGFDYSYKGVNQTLWSPQIYKVRTPQKYSLWITDLSVMGIGAYITDKRQFSNGKYESVEDSGTAEITEETKVVETKTPTTTFTPISTNDCKINSKLDLEIGDFVKVVTTDNITLSLRVNPGIHTSIAEKLKAGSILEIIDGPVCKENYMWWKVKFTRNDKYIIGWVAEGDTKENYLKK